MDDIYVYRVRQTNHPERCVRKAWYGRTWQAEFVNQPTMWAARAYTERGVRRKIAKFDRRGVEWRFRHLGRMQWWRAHVTRRNDSFYGELRKAGKL